MLLVGGALGLGEVADGLLERGAVLERQLSAEDELASPFVQVMRNARRSYSSWSSATFGGTIERAASEI